MWNLLLYIYIPLFIVLSVMVLVIQKLVEGIVKKFNGNSVRPMNDYEKLLFNVQLLEFVNLTIDVEIMKFLKFDITIQKKPYPYVKLDEDVKTISSEVLHGFDVSTLVNINNMYTTEYLSSYVINQTFLRFSSKVDEYNTSLLTA